MAFYFVFSALTVFIMGSCIGSFINVVIYRLPLIIFFQENQNNPEERDNPLSLSLPLSHCPVCKNTILKRDNIPILSWFFLKGRCRYCQAKISIFYPFTEICFGAMYLFCFLCFYPHMDSLLFITYLGLFSILYPIIFIDLKWLIIPDELSYAIIWLGLISSACGGIALSPTLSIISCATVWGFMNLLIVFYKWITKREGMGKGDAKLFAGCAALIGLQDFYQVIILASILGIGFYAYHTINYCKLGRGGAINNSNIDKVPYIPFGPAICISIFLIFSINVWP